MLHQRLTAQTAGGAVLAPVISTGPVLDFLSHIYLGGSEVPVLKEREKNSPHLGLLKRRWHAVFLSVILPDVSRQGTADPGTGRQAQRNNAFPMFITPSPSY